MIRRKARKRLTLAYVLINIRFTNSLRKVFFELYFLSLLTAQANDEPA